MSGVGKWRVAHESLTVPWDHVDMLTVMIMRSWLGKLEPQFLCGASGNSSKKNCNETPASVRPVADDPEANGVS